jgi:gluconokinase
MTMSRRAPQLLILALDCGTSSVRTALFDEGAKRIRETTSQQYYRVTYTRDGGAELSPKTLHRALSSCLLKTVRMRRETRLLKNIPIAGVAASGFWHSLLGLGRTRQPITPIYTWADARSSRDARLLREKFSERAVHARTGCMLRAPFWPAKLCWLRRTEPEIFSRVKQWVSPIEWIFRDLFGAIGCSHSMASATGLYNLRQAKWDAEMYEVCGVSDAQLSPICDWSLTDRRAPGALRETKIFPAIGDGAASNLGSDAAGGRRIAINAGTSAAVRMMETKDEGQRRKLPFGLFRYVVDSERTVFGGAISNAGNLRAWYLRELHLEENSPATDRALSRLRAATNPLTVLPFWVEERAPTWPEGLRGAILGVTQATQAADILCATTTGVFYRLAEILKLIESVAGKPNRIIVSGGVLHSIATLRLLADALGRDLETSAETEASLRGAAVHALTQLESSAIKPLPRGRIVRCDPALAAKHRVRRECQNALEQILTGNSEL